RRCPPGRPPAPGSGPTAAGSAGARPTTSPSGRCAGRTCGTRSRTAWTSPVRACPVASSSGCASPGRSPSSPRCSSWTSRARRWTRSRRWPSRTSSPSSRTTTPSSSSPTTCSRPPGSPTAPASSRSRGPAHPAGSSRWTTPRRSSATPPSRRPRTTSPAASAESSRPVPFDGDHPGPVTGPGDGADEDLTLVQVRPGEPPQPPGRPGIGPVRQQPQQGRQHRAVRAQAGRLRGGEQALQVPDRPGGAVGIPLLAERPLGDQRYAVCLRVGSQGLRAAHRRGGQQAGGGPRGEQVHQLPRPAHARPAQRAGPVVVGPAAPPDRLRVPQQQQRPDVEPAGVVRGGQRLELLAVAGVAEPRPRTVHGEPGQVVDLVLEPPVAAVDRAGPVADPLHLAAVERVARLRQGQPEAHPQPGLLQRLPDGRDHPLLTRVELALGPGPVVVPGPVDQGDLEAAP